MALLSVVACSDSGGSSPTAPPSPGNVVVSLPVSYIAPERAEWCWAAGIQMITQFYGKGVTPQCQLASMTTGLTKNCCKEVARECLELAPVYFFDVGLVEYNRINTLVQYNSMAWLEVKNELDQGQPFAAFLASPWGCRMAIVYGYTTNQYLLLYDSVVGARTVPYSRTLVYDGAEHVWTDSVYDLRPLR